MSLPSLHPAEALFDKCLDQTLSQEEQAQLDAWVCADPRNAAALARWLLAHAQTAEALAAGEAAPAAGRLPARKPVAGRLSPMLQFALVAGCLALVCGLGAWWALGGRGDAPQVAHAPPTPRKAGPGPDAPVVVRNDRKPSTSPASDPKIPVPSLDDSMTATQIQRLLLALAFVGGSAAPGDALVAEDTPTPAPAPAPADDAAPGLPPPATADAGLPPPATDIAAEDGLSIPGLDKMPASIQGSRRAIARGDFGEAIKRLEELKGKKLKDDEAAAVAKMLDYAYANGVEIQLRNIEQADPLKALQLFNLMKPPGSPGPYAPRLKDRIAALEAKVRSPEAQAQVKAGHEFNAIYDLFQSYPEDAKPKLEAFVAAHAGDPYGAMAQRVLEGKPPTEELELAVGGGGAAGTGLDEAQLAYPSEFGASKGPIPKSMAELRKTCGNFLAQSERALRADTADVPECDARFWKWVDSRPALRTGLLLAKNPVPAPYAVNLAKFYRKLGQRACDKYAQLVLAASLTTEDVTIAGKGYSPEDFSDNQKKLGKWLLANRDKVPFWKFLKEPAKYAAQADCTTEGIADAAKMAYLSHTYPPRIRSSRMQNLRVQILQMETPVPGTAWPLFPVAQTPYILLNPVASCNEAMRDREYIWNMFTGRAGYPGNAEPGMQPGPPSAPRVGTMVQYGKYGFEYTRPDVANRPSLWHPTNVIRIMEDGGVCGRMATSCSIGEVLLGIPSTPAGQPGHCALMTVSYGNGQYGASIGQSVTGTWMNTGPGQLGVSPATAGHDGEATTWLALTRTVNRVGMQNYHASLVAGYLADAVSDPAQRRDWLELAVRLNPYHLTATEKLWAMAAEGGVNSLNKAIQDSVERLALKKGKSFDDLVLDGSDVLILRKLAASLPRHYDTAMTRAGNVSARQEEQVDYKVGEGYAQTAPLTAEQKELAYKAGVGGDEKKMVKDDLELMFRYMLAFQKKGLMYGFAGEVFLKHLSRVDPETGRKFLNQMLEEALKLPIPSPENMDEGDCPIVVAVKGMIEMDSNLTPKDRARGLAELLTRLGKKGDLRLSRHNHPELYCGKTLMVDDPQKHPLYVQVFDELNKALRASGADGMKLADNAQRKYDADFAVFSYQLAVKKYALELPVYKDLAAKVGGASRLNVPPPEKPVPPVLDKNGFLVAAKDARKADPASDDARRKRGEGVKAD